MAHHKIEKAIASCTRALENLQQGNKRLSVGDLDYGKDFIVAAIHILIAEIKDEDGKF
jgi:DNA replication protein DnaC